LVSRVTALSAEVVAAVVWLAAPWSLPAGTVAITVPSEVMPLTATL